MTALSRTSDPSTSREAAALMDSTGSAATHRALCLEMVRLHPSSTAAEIALLAGLERHEPSRRLPELRSAGLVVNGTSCVCAVQRHRSMTWLPVTP